MMTISEINASENGMEIGMTLHAAVSQCEDCERDVASLTRKTNELKSFVEKMLSKNPKYFAEPDVKKANESAAKLEAATAKLNEIKALVRACNARLELFANEDE